jgi:fumarate hydratase class I
MTPALDTPAAASAAASQAAAPLADTPIQDTDAGMPVSQRPESFRYSPMLPLGEDKTVWRKVDIQGVRTIEVEGKTVLKVSPKALEELAFLACREVSHYLRPGHLEQLAKILKDPEASANDRFVAYDLLKNANIAAGGVLPMCQDTGTAIIMGKKGRASGPRARTRRRSARASPTPISSATCAIRSSPRSRCSRRRTPATTCRRRSTSMRKAP